MNKATVGGACAAGMLACSMAVFAQATPQQPSTSAQTPPSSQSTPATPAGAAQQSAAADQMMTITGCIQREADYRRTRDAGKGGVAGTGVGAANEFVLINASASNSAAATPTGTSGTASMAYELTGSAEGQAATMVGKRVEAMGKVKVAETTASGRPTGGITAGKPPAGIDVTSADLQLREFEVSSIKEVQGTCAAQ